MTKDSTSYNFSPDPDSQIRSTSGTQVLESLYQQMFSSQHYINHLEICIEQLREIDSDCKEPNWDGHGAKPVTNYTISNAERLLNCLSDYTSGLEIDALPDGSITLDWEAENGDLSISIDDESVIAYAGSYLSKTGWQKFNGSFDFIDTFPQDIEDKLQVILS